MFGDRDEADPSASHRVVPKSEADRAVIREALLKHFFFVSLAEDDLHTVIDAMERRDVRSGEVRCCRPQFGS